MKLELVSIDPRNATPEQYAQVNAFMDAMSAEKSPEDPLTPHEERIKSMQAIPPFVRLESWGARTADGQLVATANGVFLETEDNKHLLQMDLDVLPDYRRQGVARLLLERVVDMAERHGRRLLFSNTSSRIPAGESFMTALGAHKALESHENRLLIADLNRGLVDSWIAGAPTNLYELGFWDGPYPESELDNVIALHRVMNTAPRDDLEMEDFNITAEQLRQGEQHMFATGRERWTAHVRHRATGSFAGFTELVWNPNRPETVGQDGTGVFPEHRGHGLGKWLKAAMLERLLRERPNVKDVRTGNADSNAPMLKINNDLGFKPYTSNAAWQVAVETVRAYLQRHA